MVTRSHARAVLVLLALAGCSRNQYAPPPPPEVTVAHPADEQVTTYNEFTGHTASIEAVELRARVQGYLKSMHFEPGSELERGQLMFVIEPDLYRSRVEQAEADLQSAQAQHQAAEEQLAITTAIFQRNAGAKTDVVQKTQARDQAKAAVAQAQARLDAARLDLSYTQIYAPIAGRVDRNYVDIGNLVGAGEPTLLATIVAEDPIYAYFDVSERDMLEYRASRRRGETVAAEGERPAAFLGLLTDTGFPYAGEVDYVGNKLDPSTGTLEVRAVFPNPNRVLVPGLFVRVRVPYTRGRAILVPDEAISTDQGGRFVLVVDDRNVVQHRRVTVGALVEQGRIVQEGVSPADWVIVDGLQRARPGATVKPVPAGQRTAQAP